MFDSSNNFLQSIIETLAKAGVSIDVHLSIGQPQTYIDETSNEIIISDLGSQQDHAEATDLHFGFSSPAGKQYWDDDELKGKQ